MSPQKLTSEGVNGLLGDIDVGRTTLLGETVRDPVDLLALLRSMVVPVLTSSSDREHDLAWMPSTDTSDFSELPNQHLHRDLSGKTHTSMSLSWQLLNTPPGSHTLVSFTLGNRNDINQLVLLKYAPDVDLLLKVRFGKLEFVGDGSTVDLDLHEMGLLLLETSLGELGVGEDSDDGAVLLDTLDFAGDGGAGVFRVLLGVSGESLFLRSVPVPEMSA